MTLTTATTITTAPTWSVVAISRLRDAASCPVCNQAALEGGRCRSCGADLTTPAAVALWDASQRAATALSEREELRLRIPRTAPVAVAAEARRPTPPPLAPASAAPRGDTPVQAVLAVAGAGLFAVAAIVFTFFNPELTDERLRSIVTLAVTVVFLVGARALNARGLRSSAETVGALGMLFVGLDVYAAASLAPEGVSRWVFAAIGTLVAGTAMAALAVRLRLRAWIGASAVGLALVPAMLGAAGDAHARTLGWLTTVAAALALLVLLRRVTAAFAAPLEGEAAALTVVQVVAAAATLLNVLLSGDGWGGDSGGGLLWTAAGVLACLSLLARLSARLVAGPMWSLGAGAGTAAAATAAGIGAIETLNGAPLWYPIALMAAPLGGFLLVSLFAPPRVHRSWTDAGALVITGLAALPVLAMAYSSTLTTVAAYWAGLPLRTIGDSAGVAIGIGASALGFAGHAAILRRRGVVPTWTAVASAWLAAAAAAATTTLPFPSASPAPPLPWPGVAIGIVIAGATAAALARRQPGPRLSIAVPLHVGAYSSLLLAAALSWSTTGLAVAAAPAVLGAVALLAWATPARARWVHAGVGYAYALVATGAGLSLTGWGEFAVLSLVTSAGAVVAIVTTFVAAVRVHTWWTILAVTSVPFLLGILQVVRERSGWTALSTGLIFLLALTLVVTRRPGLVPALRALCAGMLVPSLSVVVICLGAQVLTVSASPVTLPVIAGIVAVALPAAATVAAALARGGLATATAALVRWAIELSALVTGVLAVGLALLRDAAGLSTAIAVLVILAVGAGTAAVLTRRVLFWWTAAASATGALWSLWRLAEIDVLEPYVLPALAAIAVGVILAARGRGGRVLAVVGLALAVVPSLVVFAVAGNAWRLGGLLGAAAVLWLLVRTAGRRGDLARLRRPALLVAIVSAAAGPVQGVRIGWGADHIAADIAFFPALAVAAAGAVLAALAGHAIARTTLRTRAARWVLAPAALYLFGGTWASIERDWTVIWAMWALLLVALCALVAVAWRVRTRDGILPPVWFLFALAFVTAVVAWSPRDLRVEWFSLPLGLALLVAGWMHLGRHAPEATGTLDSWPRRWTGSWALLAPGLVTIMSASIIATFTDPLTWRAILVIVMALAAILVGARARLSAPFLIGVIVLPIENVSAFAVQIGRGIESMPWWITLAVVGAVLLILAVSYERRAGEAEGIAARLRDLR